MRVVDYKTGRAPSPLFEAKALFQMKFYALVLWRLRGTVPALLQLVYLGNGEVLRYTPEESDLLATERKVKALWAAIERAARTGDWRASPSRLCDWCDHRALCPAFGGTPPPPPSDALERVCGPAAAVPETPGLDET
jgi:putative RecB family exonuclease